jgi:hypothetical protein
MINLSNSQSILDRVFFISMNKVIILILQGLFSYKYSGKHVNNSFYFFTQA